jgi:diguanylate cyclase (GGDEF)-like protein
MPGLAQIQMTVMNDPNLPSKLELLKGGTLFSTLGEKELEVVARNSEFYSFKRDDIIFHAGSYGAGLYLIRNGEVVINKLRDDNETVVIARFIHGESFGELDLLENRLMTATARAATDTTLLIFPRRGMNFQDLLSRHSTISSRLLHELLMVIAGRIRNTNRLISEKSPWVEDLKKLLYYDKLTGLFNRTFLEEELDSQLPGYGASTSLIMIKPDNFKTINDTWGHDIGDKALRHMASFIKSRVRGPDIPVRYRGDEFAVLLPGNGMKDAVAFSEDVRNLFSRLRFDHITEGESVSVTVSIGIASYPDHAGNLRDLIRACFNKMFEARENGGDRIACAGAEPERSA